MNEPRSTNEVVATATGLREQHGGTVGQAGTSAGQPSGRRAQNGAVPTPPPSEESRDLPQHPGATPTSPKAGPADTEASVERSYAPGSVETKLVQHIKSPRGADEDIWFELDQVSFARGKAKLQAASQQQIKNVADILKENPDVKIRVGGNADTTGTSAANQKLAQSRADAIAQALIAQGIDPERIDTTRAQPGREQTAAKTHRRPAIQITSRGDQAG